MNEKKIHYAWWILVGCCALTFGMGMTLNCCGVFLSPVATELEVGIATISLYIAFQGVAMALASPFVGKALAKYKANVVISAGYTVMLSALALMGLCKSPWQFYILGAIIGLSGAFCLIIPAPILLNTWFNQKAGFAVGLAMAFSGVGGAIFNPVLGSIVASLGWRTTYFIQAAATAVVVLPFSLFVIRSKPSDKGLMPYGYIENSAASGASGATFITGVSKTDAMKSPSFWLLFLSLGLMSIASCYVQQLTTYGISLGFASAVAATLATGAMIGNIAGKLILGVLRDKYGAKAVLFTGMGASLSGFIILILSVSNPIFVVLIIGAFFIGWANSMTGAGASLMAVSTFGAKHYGEIYSNLSVGMSLLGAFGASIIGIFYDKTGSFTTAFILGAAICVVITIFSLISINGGKKLNWEK